MIEYKVERGFMAHQFDRPTYCIGIAVQALAANWEYRCIIGKEEKVKIVNYSDAEEFVKKYGEKKIVRKQGGKDCFILPVNELRDEQGTT